MAGAVLELQRTVGNRAVTMALQTKRDKTASLRARAAALGVDDARAIVAKRYPNVAAAMSSAEVEHLQASFDRIAVEEKFGPDESRRLRLDVTRLLDPDKLVPSSDNPDEARHLERMKRWVENSGIWVQWNETYTAGDIDYTTPYLFLSLGPERSGAIATPNGRLDWAAIKTNPAVQTDLYKTVHKGSTATSFDQKVRRVFRDIEVERERHGDLEVLRVSSTLVPWVSDKFGGASYPSFDMWKVPHKLAVEALELRNAGRMSEAEQKIVAAQALVYKLSGRLSTYSEKTVAGAGIGLKFAIAAAVAADVAAIATSGPTKKLVKSLIQAGVRKRAAKQLAKKTATDVAKSRTRRRTAQEVADERAKVLERHANERMEQEIRSVKALKDGRLGGDRPIGNAKGNPRAGEGFSKY